MEGPKPPSESPLSASSAVRGYYEAVNKRDIATAMRFLSKDVLYEDLGLYAQGMRGIPAMREFLDKWALFPADVAFIVDELVDGDSSACGVTWHLEVSGNPMPFSRGVSFYRYAIDQTYLFSCV
jgi:ketosteroid isomerase-like protein